MAAVSGKNDIALGNIVGSNIANILLILGTTSVLSTIPVKSSTVWKEVPFSLLAILIVLFLGADIYFGQGTKNIISSGDGFVLIGFFILFLYYIAGISNDEENTDSGIKKYSTWVSLGMIILGLTGLMIGGKMFVDGAVKIAQII